MTKQKTSYRLSEACKGLIGDLSEKMGIDKTSVIEIGIRVLAKDYKTHTPKGDTFVAKKPRKKSSVGS